jgi:predicted nucleic acid-binding protein
MRPIARSMGTSPNPQTAVGQERNSTTVAFLVDTNILVYRFDSRYPEKKRVARDLLRQGLTDNSARIPHQALVEFMSVVTRAKTGIDALLPFDEARREVEEFMALFPILYPNAAIVRSALLAATAYKISWFDAHLWAYAEHYGLEEIVSEDFEDGRLYGSVRVRNPFAAL